MCDVLFFFNFVSICDPATGDLCRVNAAFWDQLHPWQDKEPVDWWMGVWMDAKNETAMLNNG